MIPTEPIGQLCTPGRKPVIRPDNDKTIT
jgi:hypothetical protein